MKKIIALLLLVVMCFTMVACDVLGGGNTPTPTPPAGGNEGDTGNGGNNGGETDGGDETPAPEKVRYDVPEIGYDGSEVEITFSHTMGENLRAELDMAIERFNVLFPNITVTHSQIGGYNEVRDQIKSELAGGNQPNIAYCYPDHVALYNLSKKVVPLDNFIESQIVVNREDGTTEILGLTDEQVADFIPGYYAEGAVFDAAGTMYTMPMSKSTEVLYYNKTFFDLHEIPVPTTWAEMEAVCAQIQEILKNDNNPANDTNKILGYDSESNWFITMCEQYGSNYTSTDKNNHFLFNNKTNREFVKMFRDWYEKGYVTTQELYGAYTSGLFTELDPTQPNIYMCIGSTGGAQHQAPSAKDGQQTFEVGIAPLPQVDPENPKAISQGPSLCIFDQDNKQEVVASWLFVKFITTDAEFQASFSKVSGYMPVIKSVMDIKVYSDWINSANGNSKDGVTALATKIALENTEYYFVSPAFNGSSKARDQVGELIKYCFQTPLAGSGFATVDELILDAFKKAINECLADI